MKKNRFTSGETLAETLAAILLTTLSSILFLQMALASTRISGETRSLDSEYRQALNAAEGQQTPFGQGTVMIEPEDSDGWNREYEVDYYSYNAMEGDGPGRLVSYSVREGSQ
ncbi:hypothetical protein AALB39_15040 [Lachnospiraceae bacterium 54-53]